MDLTIPININPFLIEFLLKTGAFIIIWLIALKILYNASINDMDSYNGIVGFIIGIISSISAIVLFRNSGLNLNFMFFLIGGITSFIFPIFYGQGFGFENERSIKIVLIGSKGRIGTTTMAMNIATYLESIGAKVSYTEANNSNHLKEIYNMFFKESIINKNCFTANKIDCFFNFNIPSTDYDFSIIDLGELNDDSIKIFNSIKGIKILCGGVKPYEILSLNNSIECLKNSKDYHILIIDEDGMNIEDYILNYKNYTMHNIDYSEGLFDGNANKKVWETLLNEYIIMKHKTLDFKTSK